MVFFFFLKVLSPFSQNLLELKGFPASLPEVFYAALCYTLVAELVSGSVYGIISILILASIRKNLLQLCYGTVANLQKQILFFIHSKAKASDSLPSHLISCQPPSLSVSVSLSFLILRSEFSFFFFLELRSVWIVRYLH